jgi:hypothetical protein
VVAAYFVEFHKSRLQTLWNGSTARKGISVDGRNSLQTQKGYGRHLLSLTLKNSAVIGMQEVISKFNGE